MHEVLLARTRKLIDGCPCESGCPSCVGPEGASGPLAKAVASRLLRRSSRGTSRGVIGPCAISPPGCASIVKQDARARTLDVRARVTPRARRTCPISTARRDVGRTQPPTLGGVVHSADSRARASRSIACGIPPTRGTGAGRFDTCALDAGRRRSRCSIRGWPHMPRLGRARRLLRRGDDGAQRRRGHARVSRGLRLVRRHGLSRAAVLPRRTRQANTRCSMPSAPSSTRPRCWSRSTAEPSTCRSWRCDGRFIGGPAPTYDVPHFDMLLLARPLSGRREDARDGASCSLSALERASCVPSPRRRTGLRDPGAVFPFPATGDARAIKGVLEHNRHDLLSLAAVFAHALWLAHEGPDACRDPASSSGSAGSSSAPARWDRARRLCVQTGGSRHAEPGRQTASARASWARCSTGGSHATMRRRRPGRGIVDKDAGRGRRPMSALERRAVEALAIHHEHRAPGPRRRRETTPRRLRATPRAARGLGGRDHRLDRLNRKAGRVDAKRVAGAPRQAS